MNRVQCRHKYTFRTRAANNAPCARLLFVGLACAFLFALGVGAPVFAQQRELKTESTEKVDAVLLLDTSGSMLQTDPRRLRDEGSKLFVQFLRSGDRIAVMRFDRDASVVRPFSEFKPEDVTAIGSDIAKIPTTGLYTDLLTGIKAAGDLLVQQKRADATGIVIVLSDGKMEPDPAIGTASARSEELMNTVLPGLKSAGIKVHTLAFSDQSDRQQLSEIAAATDGMSWYTPDADKIHQSFANLFLVVKKPQMLPLSAKGFTVDPDIQEATFYVNREEGGEVSLVNPDGKELQYTQPGPGIKWFRGQKFDVITIDHPAAGPWQIRGLISSDDFATVLTNLKLVSDWPAAITAGESTTLQARLNEGDKPVVLKEMSGATRYGLQIIPSDKVSEPIVEDVLYDDGTHGDKIAGDGIFSYKVAIADPGEYKIWIVAKGPTFDRRQQIPFRVKPPLISLVVGEASGEKAAHSSSSAAATSEEHAAAQSSSTSGILHGNPNDRISVQLSSEAAQLKDVAVTLSAVDGQRRRYMIPLEALGDGMHYEAAVSLLPHSGLFEIQATLTGESKKHAPVREETHLVRYNNTRPAGQENAAVEVVVDKKPVVVAEAPPNGFLPALLVLLINGALGAVLFLQLKKARSGGGFVLPPFEPAEPALAALAELESRKTLTEIALDDKILTGESVIPPTSPGLAALETGAPPPGGAQAAVPNPAAPAQGGA